MTDAPVLLQRAASLLSKWGAELTTPNPTRLDAQIAPQDLLDAAAALIHGRWGYLAAITGLDLGTKVDSLEMLYHFCAGAAIVTLRVRLPRAGGTVSSLHALIPAAHIFEREISEMFGVTFGGAPDTSRLFLADDWADGVYPLLKDARLSLEEMPKQE
jgi:Ni,Fe-hydrogenase III component G